MKPMPQNQQQAAPGAQQQGKGPQADPKVVNAFQRIVSAAGKVIYQREMTQQLLQLMQSAENPVAGVVQGTMRVLDGLAGKIKGINPNFVYTTANVVALMLLEIAEAAKIVQFDKALIGQVNEGLLAELQQRAGGQHEAAPADPAAEEEAAFREGAGAPAEEPSAPPAGEELAAGDEEVEEEDEEAEA